MSSVKLTTTGGNGGTLELKAPANTTSNAAVQLTLPVDDGAANTFLKSNGSGVTSWAGPTATEIATTSGTASASTFLCGNNTWSSAGKILQVVQTLKTSAFSTTSQSPVDITGFSVDITPSSSSSKVLVMVNLSMGTEDDNFTYAKLLRGSTVIAEADAASNRPLRMFMVYNNNEGIIETRSFNFLDSPSTTSATTYKMQLNLGASGNGYVNRSYRDNDGSTYDPRMSSSITVMEVGA